MASIAASNVITPASYTQTIIIPVPAMAGLVNSAAWAINMPVAGTLTAMRWRQAAVTTTAAKAATLQAQCNGVSCTGGSVSLASNTDTGTTGAAKAASSITAGNTFTAGQTIGFVVSGVTAFAEGSGWVELDVTN